MNKRFIFELIGFIVFILLLIGLPYNILKNYTNILLIKAYLTSGISFDNRLEDLQKIWDVTDISKIQNEKLLPDFINENVLQSIDTKYLKYQTSVPLIVITNTKQISVTQFIIGGVSGANKKTKQPGVMFGNAFLEARIFIFTDQIDRWNISVQAINDVPPPVNLEVWIDDNLIDTLSFAKGDKSIETLTASGSVSPGFHFLRIWFINDYVDPKTKSDRNAYIKQVVFSH